MPNLSTCCGLICFANKFPMGNSEDKIANIPCLGIRENLVPQKLEQTHD